MSVIIGIIGLVFGSYVVEPTLYDDGPYVFESKHESLKECQIAKHDTNAVCVGESPSNLYIKTSKESTGLVEELNFIECDYWAGCYLGNE